MTYFEKDDRQVINVIMIDGIFTRSNNCSLSKIYCATEGQNIIKIIISKIDACTKGRDTIECKKLYIKMGLYTYHSNSSVIL